MKYIILIILFSFGFISTAQSGWDDLESEVTYYGDRDANGNQQVTGGIVQGAQRCPAAFPDLVYDKVNGIAYCVNNSTGNLDAAAGCIMDGQELSGSGQARNGWSASCGDVAGSGSHSNGECTPAQIENGTPGCEGENVDEEQSTEIAEDLPTPEEVQALRDQKNNNCDTAKETAATCCGKDALACLVNSPDEYGDAATLAQTILTSGALGGLASFAGGKDLAGICKALSGLHKVGGGLNAALGLSCKNKQSDCNETCEQLQAAMETDFARCEAVPEIEWGGSGCKSLKGLISHTKKVVATCSKLNDNALAFGAQSLQLLGHSELASQCEDQAKNHVAITPTALPPPPLESNWDCTDPANANNPTCLAQICATPGNENLPQCQNINGKPTGPSFGLDNNFNTADNSAGGIEGTEVASIDPNVTAQTFGGTDQGIGEADSVANTPANNSGGGIPGGGGSGGGGAGGGGGPSTASKGYNTDIFQGERSGGGYKKAAGGGGYGGGGFSGYGKAGNGYESAKSKKRFSLKDFLPGGKKDPNRKLAGLFRKPSSQIGNKHVNIWMRVSNKYKEMCARRKLNCDK